MKHARRPVPENFTEELQDDPLPGEGVMMTCDLCGDSGDDLITLQNENGFVICADCIDGLANILVQVRRDLSEGGDLYEHRSLN